MTSNENEKATRVLIVTLHSDEQELEEGKAAIARQSVNHIEQLVISGLPKLAAHQVLYQSISERSAQFDFFVKLDADMVFLNEKSLETLLAYFSDPTLDHLVAPVFDIPSKSNIHGIHLYRSGISWGKYAGAIFTDPNPIIRGRRLILDVATPAEVNHMPNPSTAQAFLFGVHRATKIVQRDRIIKEYSNAGFQIDLLSRIAQSAEGSTDSTRRLILMGAEHVLEGDQVYLTKKDATKIAPEIEESLHTASQRGNDWPFQNWRPGSPILTRRRRRYAMLPAFWSIPGKIIFRYGYRFYVVSGLRAVLKNRRIN